MHDSNWSCSPDRDSFQKCQLVIGQRVRVTCGPLRGMSGVVASTAEGDAVLVNAEEVFRGLYIRLSPMLLANSQE